MVRARGLEPPRIAALEPKSSVSTNSTMLALLWSPWTESNRRLDLTKVLLNHSATRALSSYSTVWTKVVAV